VCRGKRSDNDQKGCISFGGSRADQTVTELLFKVLSPIGVEASLKAIEKINIESGAIRRQRELELEEARYEALLAKRRYNTVDPDNRLVASTLEKDWNDTLVKVAKLQEQLDALTESPSALSSEQKAEMKDLSQDLPFVWNHPSSSPELKKRIIRTVIKEIIVYLKDQKITLLIHWEGGDHTKLELVKNKSTDNQLRTDVDTKQIISELARIMPDKQIVAFLNRISKTTAKGHTWNSVRLRAFRSHNNIPVYRQGERQERGEFTVDEASLKLGIGNTKIWRLIQQNILPARRACVGAPWIISKEDLESEAAKKMAHSKLPKHPPSLHRQQQLFDF